MTYFTHLWTERGKKKSCWDESVSGEKLSTRSKGERDKERGPPYPADELDPIQVHLGRDKDRRS